MHFKYSISILLSNAGLMIKTIAYSLLILLFVFALGAVLIAQTVKEFVASITELGYFQKITETINAFILGEKDLIHVINSIKVFQMSMLEISALYNPQFIAGFITFFVLMFLAMVFRNFFELPTLIVINNYMSSRLKSKILTSFTSLSKMVFYAFLKSLISSLVFCLCLIICLTMVFNFGMLILYALIVIVFLSLKFAFFADWAPKVINGDNVRKAFLEEFKINKERVSDILKKFYTGMLFYSIFAVLIVTFTLTTFGIILLVLLPLYSCALKIMEMVHYYTKQNKKFYIDDYTVIEPK